MANLEHYENIPPQSPARKSSTRGFSVYTVNEQTAWLLAPAIWQNGRIVFNLDNKTLVPDSNAISSAQRKLYKVAAIRQRSLKSMPHFDTWRLDRLRRLEEIKWLASLRCDDMIGCVRAAAAERDSLELLAKLVVAEGICLNQMQLSPARALFDLGQNAVNPLRSILRNGALAPLSKGLPALLLGAIEGARNANSSERHFDDAFLKRCYKFGYFNGLPFDIKLGVRFLRQEDGHSLIPLVQSKLDELPHEYFKQKAFSLLDEGFDTTTLVNMLDLTIALRQPISVISKYFSREAEYGSEDADRARTRFFDQWWSIVQDAIVAAGNLHPALLQANELVFEDVPSYIKPKNLSIKGIKKPKKLQRAKPIEQWDYQAYLKALNDVISPEDFIVERYHLYLRIVSVRLSRLFNSDIPQTHRASWFRRNIDKHVYPLRYWLQTSNLQKFENFIELLDARCIDRGWIQRGREPSELAEWQVEMALALFNKGTIQRTDIAYVLQILCALRDRAEAQTFSKYLEEVPEFDEQSRAEINAHLIYIALDYLQRKQSQAQSELKAACDWRILLFKQLTHIHVPHQCDCEDYAHGAVAIMKALQPLDESQSLEVLTALRESLMALARKAAAKSTYYAGPWLLVLDLCAVIFKSNRVSFLARFESLLRTKLDWKLGRLASLALPSLANFPQLHNAIAEIWTVDTVRCAELIIKLNTISNFGRICDLDAFKLIPVQLHEESNVFAALNDDAAKTDLQEPHMWRLLIDTYPEASTYAAHFVALRRFRGSSVCIPPGIQKILLAKHNLRTEADYITKLIDGADPHKFDARQGERLRRRLVNLNSYVNGEYGKDLDKIIIKKLKYYCAIEQICAAEDAVVKAVRHKLVELIGRAASDIEINNNIINAVALWSQPDNVNRKHFVKLLRHHCYRDSTWIGKLHPNQLFKKKLTELGVNFDKWVDRNVRIFSSSYIAGGTVKIWLEDDPLHVLQMGNYFDTCLSFGGINSHVTIVNAIDFNKRVVFASDNEGRVIGRKLIGLTDSNELVGYHTYTGHHDAKANLELRRIIKSYCKDFALSVGIGLANDGTVRPLCCSHWYDDGAETWEDNVTASDIEELQRSCGQRANSRTCRGRASARPNN